MVAAKVDDKTPYGRYDCYLGNPSVRRAGSRNTDWTPELMDEYIRCKESVSYFCSNYVKIVHLDRGLVNFVPYPYQDGMWQKFTDERFNVVLACRQSGKTMAVVGYLLWYCLFHSEKTVAVVAHKGDQAREILSRFSFALENLPFFLQPGCKTLNKGKIEFDNNTQIFAAATSSGSLRGKSVNLLYLDEFAFVEHDVEFMTSTYPVVSSGKTSKVIITSTANGIGNQFHKIYEGAVQGINSYVSSRVDWWDVPGRDDEWREQQIANTSEEQFRQEFGNEFIGSSDTLIDPNALINMQPIKPEWTGDEGVRVYERPVEGRSYVMTVDVSKGRGKDYSTFTVTDVTDLPYRQVAIFRNSLISPMWFPDIIFKWAKLYNEAFLVVESNDEGISVCRALHFDMEYPAMFNESSINANKLGVEVTKREKRVGCSKLKDLIENQKLVVVDADTILELSTFVKKGNSYEASGSNHDDLVANLWMFGWVTEIEAFEEYSNGVDLKQAMFGDRLEELESLPFFGLGPDDDDDFEQVTTVTY